MAYADAFRITPQIVVLCGRRPHKYLYITKAECQPQHTLQPPKTENNGNKTTFPTPFHHYRTMYTQNQ